jgi:hypothetical protein
MNAGPDHVTATRAAEVVEEFALVFLALLAASLDFDHLPQASGYTGVVPNVTNIFDRLPVIVENEMAKQSRRVSRYGLPSTTAASSF